MISVAYLCLAQLPLDQSGAQGKVHIVAVDPYGERLHSPQITIQKIDDGHRAVISQGTPEMSLEYGKYAVRIAHSGFDTESRVIEVSAPELLVVVGLAIGDIEKTSDRPIIAGRVVRSSTEAQCAIIRLVPLLLASTPVEGRISATGHFSLDNVPAGAYVAVLIGPTGICRVAPVKVLKRLFQELILDGTTSQPQ